MLHGPSRRQFLAGCGALPLTRLTAATREYWRGGMVYRPLGRTGIDVSLLSFGSHTDPADRLRAGRDKTVLTAAGQARRDRIMLRALDHGVNLYDVYDSEGQWEPAARLLAPHRKRVLISLAHDITSAGIDRACRLFGHVDLYRFHTAAIDGPALESWDLLRKAKEAGKVRAIGIATHIEPTMLASLGELDGIDYLFFPYNFIHARADYGQFLPEAQRRGVGLIGMKPLASGSIMKLDPRARPGAKPEFDALQLWQTRNRPVLPAAVAELTRSLDRLPDETLCMAAMRFAYSRPFLSTAIAGMFEDRLLEDNLQAMARHTSFGGEELRALQAARAASALLDGRWLPEDYRWLEEEWRS